MALGRPILSHKTVESTLQDMESIKNADSSSNKRLDSLKTSNYMVGHGELTRGGKTNETGGRRNNLSWHADGCCTYGTQQCLVA